MRFNISNQGQTTTEYILLVAVAALIIFKVKEYNAPPNPFYGPGYYDKSDVVRTDLKFHSLETLGVKKFNFNSFRKGDLSISV